MHVLLQKVKTKKPTKRIGMEEWTYVHALGQYNIWKYSIEQLVPTPQADAPWEPGLIRILAGLLIHLGGLHAAQTYM